MRGLLIVLSIAGLLGCGAASAESTQTTAAEPEMAAAPSTAGGENLAWQAPSVAEGAQAPSYGDSAAEMDVSAAPAAGPRSMVARQAPKARSTNLQGPLAANTTDTVQATQKPGQSETATDAVDRSTPLLIYTAQFVMAVFEVDKTQAEIIALARKVNGFLSSQNNQQVVIRVPAKKFDETVTELEKLGDVLSRNIQASDVTEQYRDIRIRIQTAQKMRARMESLLAKANNVNDALRIERELQRLTQVIETLKGRLRYLNDRLAYSTITVSFRPHPTVEPGEKDLFRLPFEWLDQLGLKQLLQLRQ